MKLTSFALLALLAICSTASAQLAPQRTWPELKEAVQERANRNAYPMTGMKSEDVREILSQHQQPRSRRMGGGVEPDGCALCQTRRGAGGDRPEGRAARLT